MDDVRVGRVLRALRRRRGLRQVDLAHAAGVSQGLVSLIERGHSSTVSIRVLRRVFASVDATFEGTVMWRGGLVDRLLDERHSQLVGAFASTLTRFGWDVDVEVTFSIFGDRGSIDILATRPKMRFALIVEVKTGLHAIDETIRRLDVKHRLGQTIVMERLGWSPLVVARLLLVLESGASRRRVESHARTLGVAFPDRGLAVRSWLRNPDGRMSGLTFARIRD